MQHLYAIDLFKGVMQSPDHNTATVDINDSRKIHKALPHRNIGDVYTHFAHNLDIFFVLTLGLVVECTFADTKDFEPGVETKFTVRGN